MRFANKLNRRDFLVLSAAGLSNVLPTDLKANQSSGETVFASCVRYGDGTFGVLMFDDVGKHIAQHTLPDRGHAVALAPTGKQGVAFARRPGNFALVFDVENRRQPLIFTSPRDRHFYGHGTFSSDGKLLYTAENDFENTRGVIGIYDATNAFTRLGEFDSQGLGPHEILLHPNGGVLVIANGGIETHPDYGRAKLNIATMQPSLVFLDARSGDLIEKHQLPQSHHKLSIRHMDVSSNGEVVFGCQNEGAASELLPLVGSATLGEEINLWNIPELEMAEFANYIGSVCIDREGQTALATMPKGSRIAIFSLKEQRILRIIPSAPAFGASHKKREFVTTSTTGIFDTVNSPIYQTFQGVEFDNHLSSFELF